MYYGKYDSPLGELLLVSDGEYLTGLYMNRPVPEQTADVPVLQRTARWLDAYFAGESLPVEIPIRAEGTAFRRQVWQLLREIPFGQTRSYGELARELAASLGKEKMSAQAVGQAVGKNPVSILIPCHRVVGAQGQLTGYAGGLANKQWLLRHEGEKRL